MGQCRRSAEGGVGGGVGRGGGGVANFGRPGGGNDGRGVKAVQ